MDRVRFIDQRGTRILFSDLSGIRATLKLQRVVFLGSELVKSQPPHSLLILVDVTDVEYNIESFAILQQSVAVNRPYVVPTCAPAPLWVFRRLRPFRLRSSRSFPAARWQGSTTSRPRKTGWFRSSGLRWQSPTADLEVHERPMVRMDHSARR